jgi:signal peptidase I
MLETNNSLTKFLKSRFSVLLLPIIYTVVLSILNFPVIFLIVPFLIGLIVARFKLTGKILTIFTSIGYFILSGIFIRTFIQEARFIDGSSMMPTLQSNDRVLVDKLEYYFQDPQRSDVILFSPTEARKKMGLKDAAVGRVIGLPNESIEMREGHIYIDEKLIQEKYSVNLSKSQFAKIIVPRGVYIVMNDNRSNRENNQFELVPKDKILGKVKNIFWPVERNRLIH